MDSLVAKHIKSHFTPYSGAGSFLVEATERTKELWGQLEALLRREIEKGVLDIDTETPSTITSHQAGYIDRDLEIIYGLQTDAPLKRAIKPRGGVRVVNAAVNDYGYQLSPELFQKYSNEITTHNDAVFNLYNDNQRKLRSKHVITGLPDNYARGRIIGDYRRVALLGLDKISEAKRADLAKLERDENLTASERLQLREEIGWQLTALDQLKELGEIYGFELARPAADFKEAVQWIYLAYLAAVKQHDGAAMSLGRIDAFLDIYAEADLGSGKFTESEIQEIIDDFVIKLRMVRHLRPHAYNQLFAGDPTWVTLVLGGATDSGESLVTKTSYRFLHTLSNLGPAPEPNLTILWSSADPDNWKAYCAKQSIDTSSIQYENDALMQGEGFGDDYAISCCVSALRLGEDMQYFGARANLAKALLLSINGGKEEPVILDEDPDNDSGGELILPGIDGLESKEKLEFTEVWEKFKQVVDQISRQYVETMNVIHYSHDRYNYESLQMALHDSKVRRFMAFGIAGLSIVADSLSAIKYAEVRPKWNSKGVAESYGVTGDFPMYGNDDDRVDEIARDICSLFINSLRKYPAYRDAIHTLSILTITSNVMYGLHTGDTPDGRKSGQAFAPGANPMHGRDHKGLLASLNSVAKIDYSDCLDGISNTVSLLPATLGKAGTNSGGDGNRANNKASNGEMSARTQNLSNIISGYFAQGGHHLNVNVISPEQLRDAQLHPEKYPQLTIRVSGYAVLFNKLSKAHQDEVISRTFQTSA